MKCIKLLIAPNSSACKLVLLSKLRWFFFVIRTFSRIRPFKCVNVCAYISGLTLMCAYTYPFRWRFVVHGGIDGFSRLIVYLSAATNNRAATVLRSFLEAANVYGCHHVWSQIKVEKMLTLHATWWQTEERTGIHTLLAGVSIIKGTFNFKSNFYQMKSLVKIAMSTICL